MMAGPSDLESIREPLYLSGTLSLRSTAVGGRHTPIGTGYRPDASLGRVVDDLRPGVGLHGCIVEFEGDPIEPGSSRPVKVVPRHPEDWRSIIPGTEVGIHEGARRVGTLRVSMGLDADALDAYLAAVEAETSTPIPNLTVPEIKFLDRQPGTSTEHMAEDSEGHFRFGSSTSPDEAALIDDIAGFHPALVAMLGEHEEYHETILSYLFMADVARWASEQYQAGRTDSVVDLFALLERHFEDGDQHVQNLIAVGFVESMPSSAEATGALRTLLGPRLAQVFREVNW